MRLNCAKDKRGAAAGSRMTLLPDFPCIWRYLGGNLAVLSNRVQDSVNSPLELMATSYLMLEKAVSRLGSKSLLPARSKLRGNSYAERERPNKHDEQKRQQSISG